MTWPSRATAERVREIIRILPQPISLESTVGDETDAVLADFDAGKTAALARVVSIVENHREGFEQILSTLHSRTGRARRIGLTGPPGAGKSTMLKLVAGITYEVFARYVFHAPTVWSYDVAYMLYGTIFMLGAAYALLKGAHVRTDIFWDNFSERKKGYIDFWSYLLLFYPTMLVFFAISADDAWFAYQLGERSEQTPWRPILWPFKAVVPLTALLLLVQGVSELLKSLYAARTGRFLTTAEMIQV